eukprot:TRINITY_DN6530_c0_g1_i6.p1 TRINITY_DN6530_c0_g1~~TRINITY_DN6530_c0_g1_i6.p1  ORF type:complete len:891 (-),score=169.15 TRINITY_DN6530_c0_g1_i6:483-3155(-)
MRVCVRVWDGVYSCVRCVGWRHTVVDISGVSVVCRWCAVVRRRSAGRVGTVQRDSGDGVEPGQGTGPPGVVLCDRCEAAAELLCDQCQLPFCTECAAEMHQRDASRWRHHTLLPLLPAAASASSEPTAAGEHAAPLRNRGAGGVELPLPACDIVQPQPPVSCPTPTPRPADADADPDGVPTPSDAPTTSADGVAGAAADDASRRPTTDSPPAGASAHLEHVPSAAAALRRLLHSPSNSSSVVRANRDAPLPPSLPASVAVSVTAPAQQQQPPAPPAAAAAADDEDEDEWPAPPLQHRPSAAFLQRPASCHLEDGPDSDSDLDSDSDSDAAGATRAAVGSSNGPAAPSATSQQRPPTMPDGCGPNTAQPSARPPPAPQPESAPIAAADGVGDGLHAVGRSLAASGSSSSGAASPSVFVRGAPTMAHLQQQPNAPGAAAPAPGLSPSRSAARLLGAVRLGGNRPGAGSQATDEPASPLDVRRVLSSASSAALLSPSSGLASSLRAGAGPESASALFAERLPSVAATSDVSFDGSCSPAAAPLTDEVSSDGGSPTGAATSSPIGDRTAGAWRDPQLQRSLRLSSLSSAVLLRAASASGSSPPPSPPASPLPLRSPVDDSPRSAELLGCSPLALDSPLGQRRVPRTSSDWSAAPDSPSSIGGSSRQLSAEELRAKRLRLQQEVIKEIISTEIDYISDLEVVLEVFLFPIKIQRVMPEPDTQILFSNVETLHNCNSQLLEEWKARSTTASGQDAIIVLGEIFQKMSPFFKMYTVYCANQPKAMDLLTEYMKRPDFVSTLRICETDPKCRGLPLHSFLIKPIQRICKYPLLFRELLKLTDPEERERFTTLENACQVLEQVAVNINEGKRNAEKLNRIFEIQKCIDGSGLVWLNVMF